MPKKIIIICAVVAILIAGYAAALKKFYPVAMIYAPCSFEELPARADELMYEVKRSSKNGILYQSHQ